MNKTTAGLLVGGATVLGTMVVAGPAQAYPVEPPPAGPSENVSPPIESGPNSSTTVSTPSSSAAGLPATGGPDGLLLGGGAALLLAGGAVVVASRRRSNES